MFEQLFFFLSAGLTIGCAFLVVGSKNLMHSCLFLLGTLFGVSGLYAVLGADFLAATQLVIYAGGVVILMLFAVMLTGGAENKPNRFGMIKIAAMGNLKTYIVAALVAIVALSIIFKIVIGLIRFHVQGELPPISTTVEKIGTLLVTDHVLAFEISSVLLLGALIGAAVIARPRRS